MREVRERRGIWKKRFGDLERPKSGFLCVQTRKDETIGDREIKRNERKGKTSSSSHTYHTEVQID